MTEEQTELLEKEAKRLAVLHNPFTGDINSKGEVMEQRVGQRPYGIKKWEKEIDKTIECYIHMGRFGFLLK